MADSNYPLKTNHWIVASTVHSTIGNVHVYDSIYDAIDKQRKDIIISLFGTSNKDIVLTHKQEGTQDCGLYSITICVSLAFNLKPEQLKFDQSAMRGHLINCIETLSLSCTNRITLSCVVYMYYVLVLLCTANCLRWKSFMVEEMNCNSLVNICGCMVILCITQGHYH